MQSKSALRGRRVNDFVKLWCLVASGGLKIWVSWISFQKVTSAVLNRTSELSRFLNAALFWCFETRFILVESWNIMLNFSTFPIGGCWGQVISLFWKLVLKTHISKPPEVTSYQHNYLPFYPSKLIYFALKPFKKGHSFPTSLYIANVYM